MHDLWQSAKDLPIVTGKDIVGGFDVGFDGKIPEQTKDALMRFVYWVEDHYALPVTLWVDFKYNHYLHSGDKKRVGYKFYWADFKAYPAFEDFDDIPVIELPVRTGKQTMDQILKSFIEAITHYFAWLSRLDLNGFVPDPELVNKIFETYQSRGE